MSPWLRLWTVFVAAVAAVLFLKALPAPIVLVLFVGGVATVNVMLRGRVRRGGAVPDPTMSRPVEPPTPDPDRPAS